MGIVAHLSARFLDGRTADAFACKGLVGNFAQVRVRERASERDRASERERERASERERESASERDRSKEIERERAAGVPVDQKLRPGFACEPWPSTADPETS